jgi:colicin import membrane protein
VRARLSKSFDTKPEVVEATKRMSTAKARYDAAAAPVVKSVESSAAYKSDVAAAGKADQEVASLRGNTEATPRQRMDAAKQALEARNALSQSRNDALAADPKASAAKTEYDEATAALNKLKAELEDTVKDDDELASAKEALDDAKAKTQEAEGGLAEANKELAAQNAKRQAAMDEQRRIDREYAAQQRSNKSKRKG